MVMGIPAAGKSTLTRQFVADGYLRLNRDESGGTLRGLLPELRRALQDGTTRVVLDNTYVTRKSRAEVIQAAGELGVPVRCVWLTTGIDDAQVNAVTRLVERYGHLPGDRELKQLRKTDVAAFPPSVLFRYQRELEPPDPSEGFSSIEQVPFTRLANPAHVNRAVIAWCDDPSQLEALAPALREHQDGGWIDLRAVVAARDRGRDAHRRGRAGVVCRRRRSRRPALRPRHLPARRRPAALLVPQAVARPRRGPHPSPCARSRAVPVRRQWAAGRRVRAQARLPTRSDVSQRVARRRPPSEPGGRLSPADSRSPGQAIALTSDA